MIRKLFPRVALLLTLGATAAVIHVSCCNVQPAPEPKVAAVPKPTLMSWRVASAYLEDIFTRIPNSSIDDFRKDTPPEERKLVNSAHGETGVQADNAHVYGEPAPMTTDLMLGRVGASDNDVLYDLGSGRSFFLMQALLTSPIKKAVGVELAHSRAVIAEQARSMMLEQGLMPPGKVLDLREQDMAKTNVEDATIVYMDSVFFTDELLNGVARNLSRAKNMRWIVMITKGMPPNPWFELATTERLKMSWSPKFGSDVLFYKRTTAPAG
jgi:hypothetical protein